MGDTVSIGDRLQSILSQGLDAAASVAAYRYAVSNATPQTSAPNGVGYAAGRPAGTVQAAAAGVPGWVWPAGLALVALVVVVPLLRRR